MIEALQANQRIQIRVRRMHRGAESSGACRIAASNARRREERHLSIEEYRQNVWFLKVNAFLVAGLAAQLGRDEYVIMCFGMRWATHPWRAMVWDALINYSVLAEH